MTTAHFIALRDRGSELWTEIEAHRLGQEMRIVNKSRQNLYLSIIATLAGVIAGTSGAIIFEDLGVYGKWTVGISGFVAAICAAMNPILRFSEEIQSATAKSQELKALQDAIRNHIYRMQIQTVYTVEDQQLFFEQRADDFRTLSTGADTTYSRFEDDAIRARDRNNFPKLEYVGEVQIEDADSIQELSDEIVPFRVGV